ncbi:MAG: hypothetical protein Q8909_13245 [Bacteroidota bacterium]|nr:hypothetical protein [Bacteroidota bacterium]
MKRILISIAACLLCLSVFSETKQSKADSASILYNAHSEIRLNLLMAVMGYPEVSIEHYATNNSGFGLGLALALEKPEIVYSRLIATPFYRFYFGSKRASGLFIECFGMMTVAEIEGGYSGSFYSSYYYRQPSKEVDLGFGASLGYKLLTKSGLTGNLTLGVGRLYQSIGTSAYPRIEVAIGKRF